MNSKYQTMTTRELREYVLQHPTDDLAFYTFVDRKHLELTNPKIIEPDDPEREAKSLQIIQELINKQNA